jgi:flavoprotein, HI0933 family
MYDVIVIGAGPSGLMSAIETSKKFKTLLLEKNDGPGKKLLITGGGRCNVTNYKNNKDFINEIDHNKKYIYSIINNFGPYAIYDYFTNKKTPLKIEEEGKVFPKSNKSANILNTLINDTKAEIHYKEEVLEIKTGEIKEIITNKNTYKSKNIIICTGGSSFPKTGSNGSGIKFAKMIKQPTTNLFPAETSIILKEKLDLAGTSFENVEITNEKKKTSGNLIFTHNGLSGEAIMKLSEYIYKSSKKEVIIDLLPNMNEEQLKEELYNFDREKELGTYLSTHFSKKFSLYLLNKTNIDKKIKSLTKSDIEKLLKIIKNLKYDVKSVSKIEDAYVTGGGVDMNFINTKTMESKIHKGIYFAGETLDIHGPIGGYNITLALASGYTAGNSIKEKI